MPVRRLPPRGRMSAVLAIALLATLSEPSLAEEHASNGPKIAPPRRARLLGNSIGSGAKASESDASRQGVPGADGSKASRNAGGEQEEKDLQPQQRLFLPLTKRARAGGAVYGVDVGEGGLSRRRLELEIDLGAVEATGENAREWIGSIFPASEDCSRKTDSRSCHPC